MTKRQAERLAAKIRKDPDAGVTVIGLGMYSGLRWRIDLQDHTSGYIFTIGSPQDWKDRQGARAGTAKHGA